VSRAVVLNALGLMLFLTLLVIVLGLDLRW
jgi:hypothetical protein